MTEYNELRDGQEFYCNGYKKGYEDAKKEYARPQGTWKLISESWPVLKGYYLTTTIHREVYCDYWNGESFDRTEAVIAWMPLPKPCEGKENEDDEPQ